MRCVVDEIKTRCRFVKTTCTAFILPVFLLGTATDFDEQSSCEGEMGCSDPLKKVV